MKWQLKKIKTADLKEWGKNPRKLNKKGLEDLEQSIVKFGVAEPLVVNTDLTICGGHGRLKILKKLAIKEVDCYLPERELTEKEFEELNIRLNKNIAGDFDMDLLEDNFNFDDLLDWGFEESELNFNIGWNPPKSEEALKGDGIIELTGYNLASFWKDIKNENADVYPYQIDLPFQNIKNNMVRQKYSRTNLEEIERIIRTYMRKGDYFLENCCGWSTFGSSAKHWGYSGIGIDIWDTAIKHSKKQIAQIKNASKVNIIEMNGMHLKFEDNKFDYIYCNPPFMNAEKYSKAKNDIADNDFGKFSEKFIKLMSENYRVLKKDCLCTITINDKREESYLISMQKYVIEWSEKAGFKLWDFVIAEVLSQKIRLRKKDYELKRTVKCHEYIITFKK